MSSHREAPEIAKDPVADSTDLYAFVSPDDPDMVTLIANYVPLEGPAGGPNFFEFGDDVMYKINISNSGSGKADLVYEFTFSNEIRNPDTFLYNTGQITSLNSTTFNRRQFYTVKRWTSSRADTLGTHLASPPCNIGPRSTPKYGALAASAVHSLPGNRKVFAGQRADGFWVDLGSVFDLLALRPFQNLHVLSMPATDGINTLANLNVHTIALQVPISDLTRNGKKPTNQADPAAVVGIWTSAFRRTSRTYNSTTGTWTSHGDWKQVSRLGNPLFNEVIVPMGKKDGWNSHVPATDSAFLQNVQKPEVAGLLPGLYPGVFPNLAKLTADRADLVAILLTGLPSGVVSGFQNYTGSTYADMLRLNVAIPPTSKPNSLGIIGGDLAGFPNGRRVTDNVVSIELRAIAGATYPLVMPSYQPDGAASLLTDGSKPPAFLKSFPYLGVPYDGFSHPSPPSS